MSSVTPLIVRCVSRREHLGLRRRRRRAPTASSTAANTRPEPRVHPGPAVRLGAAISFQSMSSSNGPANSMIRRIVSAPQRSTIGIGSTMLPFVFDIDAPP